MSQIEVNKIIVGDCLEVMKDWPDNCVDLVLTDPPYNVALGTKKHSQRQEGYVSENDNLTLEEYGVFVQSVEKCILRISSTVIVTPGNANQTLWSKPTWTMAWTKKNGCTRTPLTRGVKMNHSCWEPILIYGKLFSPPKFDVLDYPIRRQPDAEKHPCPKPLGLFAQIIEFASELNSLVLDPFCGSGTTCVAAKILGRRYIGIDISEEYCEIARMRLKAVDTGVSVAEQRQGQQSLFERSE